MKKLLASTPFIRNTPHVRDWLLRKLLRRNTSWFSYFINCFLTGSTRNVYFIMKCPQVKIGDASILELIRYVFYFELFELENIY